jgi:hypothetical protein
VRLPPALSSLPKRSNLVLPAAQRCPQPILASDSPPFIFVGEWTKELDPEAPFPHVVGVAFLPSSRPPAKELTSDHLRKAIGLDRAPLELFVPMELVAGALTRPLPQAAKIELALYGQRLLEGYRQQRIGQGTRKPRRGEHKGDAHYVRVALLYLQLVSEEGPRRINESIREHIAKEGLGGSPWKVDSTQQVADWVRAARKRGLLTRPGRGRVRASMGTQKLERLVEQMAHDEEGRKR